MSSSTVEYCLFTEPQEGASYDELLAHAQHGEALGFDGWFRSDHYLRMAEGSGEPGPTDAWTTLAGLARETRRVRLGTLVSSVTFRHPGILAIQVAQVDRMSGGRVELGLGTGWFREEHEKYGIPFPAKRFDLLEEQLQIVSGLWSTPQGESFSFAGEHYRLDGAPALPKPQQERIPLIVGGNGPQRTPSIAARFASEFNIGFVDDDTILAAFRRVRAAAESIGRDPDDVRCSIAQPTVVGETEREFRARAARIHADPDELRSTNLGGTVDEVAERIARFGEFGASRLYLQTIDVTDLDHVSLLAERVLPAAGVHLVAP